MSGVPPSWIGVDQNWNLHLSDNRHVKAGILKPGVTYNFETMIENDEIIVSVVYFFNEKKIAGHKNRKLLNRCAYVKFGIYRVLSEGTTTFIYENPTLELTE